MDDGTTYAMDTNLVGRRCRLTDGSGGVLEIVMVALKCYEHGDLRPSVVVMRPDGGTSTHKLFQLQLEAEHGMFDESSPEPLTVLGHPLSADEAAAMRTLIVAADSNANEPSAWHWAKAVAAAAAVSLEVFESLRRHGIFESKGEGGSLQVRPSSFTRRIMANPDNLTERSTPEAEHGMFDEEPEHDERAGPRSSFQLPTSGLTGTVPVSLAVFRDQQLAQLAEQCIQTLTSRGTLPNQMQQDAVVAGEHIAKVGLYLDEERR